MDSEIFKLFLKRSVHKIDFKHIDILDKFVDASPDVIQNDTSMLSFILDWLDDILLNWENGRISMPVVIFSMNIVESLMKADNRLIQNNEIVHKFCTKCCMAFSDGMEYKQHTDYLLAYISLQQSLLNSSETNNLIISTGSWEPILHLIINVNQLSYLNESALSFIKQLFVLIDDKCLLKRILSIANPRDTLKVDEETSVNYLKMLSVIYEYCLINGQIEKIFELLISGYGDQETLLKYIEEGDSQILLKYTSRILLIHYIVSFSHNNINNLQSASFETTFRKIIHLLDLLLEKNSDFLVIDDVCYRFLLFVSRLIPVKYYSYIQRVFRIKTYPVVLCVSCILNTNDLPFTSRIVDDNDAAIQLVLEKYKAIITDKMLPELSNNCLLNITPPLLKKLDTVNEEYFVKLLIEILEQFVDGSNPKEQLVLSLTELLKQIVNLVRNISDDIKHFENGTTYFQSITRCTLSLLNITVISSIQLHRAVFDLLKAIFSISGKQIFRNVEISSIKEILMKELHDDNWELRDSALELAAIVIDICDTDVVSLRMKIITDNFLEAVLSTKTDDSNYVRSSVYCLLATIVKYDDLWYQYLHSKNFVEEIIENCRREMEGIVRKDIVALINKMYEYNRISEASIQNVYRLMLETSCKDLHWEVIVNSLYFWGMVIDVKYAGVNGKDANETDVWNLFQYLSTCGCFKALQETSYNDFEFEVIKVYIEIIKKLKNIVQVHRITCGVSSRKIARISSSNITKSNLNTTAKQTDSCISDGSANNYDKGSIVIESIIGETDQKLVNDFKTIPKSCNTGVYNEEKIHYISAEDFIQFMSDVDCEQILSKETRWNHNLSSMICMNIDDIISDVEESDTDLNALDCY